MKAFTDDENSLDVDVDKPKGVKKPSNPTSEGLILVKHLENRRTFFLNLMNLS